MFLVASVVAAHAQSDPDEPPAPVKTEVPAGPPVTYAQIAPILRKSCVSCHNPSGGAPFNLTTYTDAKQWGGQILQVTQSRYMPPWLPVPDLHSPAAAPAFKGEKRLSDTDLEALRKWVGAGMLEGPALPAANYDSAALVKQAGHADLTLTPSNVIHVPASGPDIFLTLALPVPDGPAHAVRAIGIEASDPQAAHSILMGVDEKRLLRSQHPEVLATGLPGMELSPELTEQLAPGGRMLLWTPDLPILTAAEPFMLRGGSDLVLTIHVKTTGRAEDLSFKVLLYYAKTSAPRVAHTLLHLDWENVEIPAGDKEYKAEAELRLDQATTLTSIYPRAHYTAVSLQAFATLPDGTQRALLTIDKWDADWTAVYRFAKPVVLPKGTVLHMRWNCDNSSNNPHNPSDPPKKVVGGHGAKDEVAELWLETTSTH
jgi:mono/diheme cytochrome c family protein